MDVGSLNFKLELDYGRDFLKLVLCLSSENSCSDLVYLWVGAVPEKSSNFASIFKSVEVQNLLTIFNCTMTVDLKAASNLLGLAIGRYPFIWFTWDVQSGICEEN